MKRCVINQFFGIGDIIFIEPIMRMLWQKGHEVILPVLPIYEDIQPYFPYVKVVPFKTLNINYDCQKIIETDSEIIYPLRWSKEYFNSPLNDTMRNKYRMFDLHLETWRNTTWLRHRWKEDKLRNMLGIKYGEKYMLVNNNFHSYNNSKRTIEVKGKIKQIVMDFAPGFTLFDWAGIIEQATEIHVVNSSTLFLFEVLNLKAKEIHLYSRNAKSADFHQTEYLRSKKYILHD